jgi:hypothetical protein
VDGFTDDGIKQCRAVLAALELIQQQHLNTKILSADEHDLLKQFIQVDLKQIQQTDFLPLVSLKNTLIDLLTRFSSTIFTINFK